MKNTQKFSRNSGKFQETQKNEKFDFLQASNNEKLQQFSPIFGVFWAFSVNSLKIYWNIAKIKVNYGKFLKNSIVFPETQLFFPKLRNFFKTQAKISSKLKNTKNLRFGRRRSACKKKAWYAWKLPQFFRLWALGRNYPHPKENFISTYA